ncbi:MAG: hypothetical protein WCC48_02085 [Anaeromyxobacteraceae bacterium]
MDVIGKSSRIAGPAYPVRAGGPVVTIDSAEEAFRLWKSRGLHGRIVVSLSARLYFVEPEIELSSLIDEAGRVVDPVEVAERSLGPKNFLWMALERGVARELRHVLPEPVFSEKAASLLGDPLVEEGHDEIRAPYLGSPRLLTTLEGLGAPSEPVLLFVSASFFSDRSALDVARRLTSLGLRTDLVVLCRSLDDPEVTPLERARLEQLAVLLGAVAP